MMTLEKNPNLHVTIQLIIDLSACESAKENTQSFIKINHGLTEFPQKIHQNVQN